MSSKLQNNFGLTITDDQRGLDQDVLEGKGGGGRNRQFWGESVQEKASMLPKVFHSVFVIKYFQNYQQKGRGGGPSGLLP